MGISSINSMLLKLSPTQLESVEKHIAGYVLQDIFQASSANARSVYADDGPSEIDGKLTLFGLFRNHYQPKRLLGKSHNTVRLYQTTIRKFSTHLGRYVTLDDLNDITVSNYLQYLIDNTDAARASVEKEATQLLALWRYASRRNLGPEWPEISPPKSPETIPEAWTIEELQQLFRACEQVKGKVAGLPAGLYWTCLVSIVLDCGERIGAIRSLQWADLRNEYLNVKAEYRKGGKRPMQFKLRPSTVELLAKLRSCSHHDTIFPWELTHSYFWDKYGKILEAAGLPNNRRTKLHALRRTVATLYEKAGGNATKLLGHSNRKVTERYIDERVVRTPQPCDLIPDLNHHVQ